MLSKPAPMAKARLAAVAVSGWHPAAGPATAALRDVGTVGGRNGTPRRHRHWHRQIRGRLAHEVDRRQASRTEAPVTLVPAGPLASAKRVMIWP